MSDSRTAQSASGVSALIMRSNESGGSRTLLADESWLQGRSWFGGVQLAFAMQSARDQVDASLPVRSLHAAFLAPVGVDAPVEARSEVLREGRSVVQVRATLMQEDRRCFELLALFGRERESSLRYDSDQPLAFDPEGARRLGFRPGLTPNCTQHYDMRWLRGDFPFTGVADPRSTILVRPAASVAYDEAEFLALTDTIPPAAISMLTEPGPASSMNCALELIRPEAVYGTRQWIRFEVELHDAHSGYAWQTARLYAESGALLAIAHQSVAVFG